MKIFYNSNEKLKANILINHNEYDFYVYVSFFIQIRIIKRTKKSIQKKELKYFYF
jgi:hypothetical protein